MGTTHTRSRPSERAPTSGRVSSSDLLSTVADQLNRRPSAGLALGIVDRDGLAWFHGHGVAEVSSRASVTEDTVFRIGSITKTFTAIAVLQLWERGLVDLDGPVDQYLRAFRLTPARGGLSPVTVRHLLTHTAGIGYWRTLSDLLRPGIGSGIRAGRSVPSLAEYYRRGLPVEVEPGTKWMYTNHGFAVLGQIVEDVTGQPLDRYLRDHVFGPLGMEHTDLSGPERLRSQRATGYLLRADGLRPVDDRACLAVGGGAAYSTTVDLARYVTALLRGGADAHGAVLRPETLASMFEPHFQPDPRVPGMGLGFLLGQEGPHRTVGHDGIMSGFLSQMTLAPEQHIGVVVLANTGGLDGRGTPVPLGIALLRQLLDLPADAIRSDVPAQPEIWGELCGWYGPDPGAVTNLFTRIFIGAGAEITARGGHLTLKPLNPLPAIRRGMWLHPDDPDDPRVFRVDLAGLGLGTLPLVFAPGDELHGQEPRLFLNGMSLAKRPDARNPRRWATGALLGCAGGCAGGIGRLTNERKNAS
jgi:CubicO group peptidase (beta-lactamase class C family)